MNRHFHAIAAAILLFACASEPGPAPVAIDPKKVLILAPQGVAAEKDTVGFNTLVKNLTQAFSPEFSEQLAARGYSSVNVLDQQPGLDVGQKMALHAVRNAAVKITIVTMETESVDGDTQLQLRVQFVEGELTTANSAPTGLRARTVVSKSYVLRSKSGDTTLTMTDLAKDFAGFLEASGRFKE